MWVGEAFSFVSRTPQLSEATHTTNEKRAVAKQDDASATASPNVKLERTASTRLCELAVPSERSFVGDNAMGMRW